MRSAVWQAFLRSWRQHFIMQLATLTVLTASLTAVTFFITLSLNLKRVVAEWGDSLQMTVYLKDDLSNQQVSAVESALKSMEAFQKVIYVSKQEALKTFSNQLSSYAPDLLKDGGFENSFPASFQVDIKHQSAGLFNYDWLLQKAKQISAISGVEDVSYGQGWLENYSQFVSGLSSVGWMLVSVLLLGSLFVIGNSIRTSIMQRREEIEILELIGSTPEMIRTPYLFEGAAMGALAAVLSLAFNYAIYLAQLRLVQSNWSFMGLASHLRFLGLGNSIALILAGAILGLLGAFVTVRNVNNGWAASQRLQS